MANYYLYRHIRLDKNEPFYIGIGTKPKFFNTLKQEYSRAYQKINRNNHWKNIVSLTEINVDILFETDDYELIKNKEKEFISLYGRKDLNRGSLVNFTDGGDGTLGTPSIFKGKKSPERITKEGIEKMRKSKLNQKMHLNTKNALIQARSKRLFQYTKDSVLVHAWFSVSDASRNLNLSNRSLVRAALGQNKINKHFYKNYLWSYGKPE